jgi:hypothetical protein
MTTKEHLDKHDREIAAIRSLLKQGMRMLVDSQSENRVARIEMRQAIRELQQSQKRTEKNLADLIAALGRGTNGKH